MVDLSDNLYKLVLDADLNIIMKTIMMGKMEMVLPDIHMMNKFMGTCLKGPRATSQLLLIFKFGSASRDISECDIEP